ncbi:MAG: hypothetical protein FJX36_13230 [Alphaproteobacteria bacterium]|nr:hypothetical protein [Alphaproteobacteria bacterium]
MPEFEFPTPMTANPFATYVVATDMAAGADAGTPVARGDMPRQGGGWAALARAAIVLVARALQGPSA